MDILDQLLELQNSGYPVSLTLSCRLGNPAEQQIISKSGTIIDLDVNTEKPRQTSFYIKYAAVQDGGAVRFKAHPHEVISILDNSGQVIYSTSNE